VLLVIESLFLQPLHRRLRRAHRIECVAGLLGLLLRNLAQMLREVAADVGERQNDRETCGAEASRSVKRQQQHEQRAASCEQRAASSEQRAARRRQPQRHQQLQQPS
jgi:hypothetical protein